MAHTPFPPFSPSLISLMVSVDVKHHVYLLTMALKIPNQLFRMALCLTMMHHHTSLVTDGRVGQKISSGQITEITNVRCGLELERNNPVLLLDTGI